MALGRMQRHAGGRRTPKWHDRRRTESDRRSEYNVQQIRMTKRRVVRTATGLRLLALGRDVRLMMGTARCQRRRPGLTEPTNVHTRRPTGAAGRVL